MKSGFLDAVGGAVVQAPVEVTCSSGKNGSHLDYIVCSVSARPLIKSIAPVVSVPWKPHIGLSVEILSEGTSLETRVLKLPGRLPQGPRPTKEATEGSK
eukprot:4228689-Pyramimonas_sp.AAC.1